MVLGAIQAAEAAGRTGIVFVGFDAIDDAVQAVKEANWPRPSPNSPP